MENSIEAFFRLINGEYFTNNQYTVSSVANGNPPGSHMYCVPPEQWIENTATFMTQMFNAAGINPTAGSSSNSTATSTEKGNAVVEAAREKLGCPYVYGGSGPNNFDCSGLTLWCYNKIGISLPHSAGAQKNSAKKVVQLSEARVGDILFKEGHVGIYIGNNQYIHAPTTGDVVRIATGIDYFDCALQFY